MGALQGVSKGRDPHGLDPALAFFRLAREAGVREMSVYGFTIKNNMPTAPRSERRSQMRASGPWIVGVRKGKASAEIARALAIKRVPRCT